jgi:hypothetical protein
MKTIPYKDVSLVKVTSERGCWGCYFLSDEMGCHCPEYFECGHYEVFMQVSRQGLKKTDQAKEMISNCVCHEVVNNCDAE